MGGVLLGKWLRPTGVAGCVRALAGRDGGVREASIGVRATGPSLLFRLFFSKNFPSRHGRGRGEPQFLKSESVVQSVPRLTLLRACAVVCPVPHLFYLAISHIIESSSRRELPVVSIHPPYISSSLCCVFCFAESNVFSVCL